MSAQEGIYSNTIYEYVVLTLFAGNTMKFGTY
jgi:hypothetical protein